MCNLSCLESLDNKTKGQEMKKTNWKKIGIGVGAAALVMCLAGSVFAAGFGGVGENIGEQSAGLAKGVKQIGFLIGLFLVVGGLVIFATLKKTNTQAVVPISMLAVGVCLLALTTFISTGSETLFGSDKTTSSRSSLNLD